MVFASRFFATEDQERAFRDEVEGLLREARAADALAAIDARLAEIADRPVAAAALAVDADHVRLTGWQQLPRTIAALDAHGQPISAVSIDFARPSDETDELVIETSYYCDDVFPFSTSDRGKIGTSYGRGVVRWRDKHDHRDREIGVSGLDALYDACRAVQPGDAEPDDHDAIRLGRMRCAVLLYMAVARAVAEVGLPHALVVLCGSDENYPFFDAPVTTRDEYEEATDAQAEAGDTDEALFTSLATLAPVRPNATYRFEPETEHLSGRSLRHKLVRELQENANDAGEELQAGQARPSLLGRLFRRSA
ncbi:MAG TPA: hypothetical protein VHN58_12850 [Croceicoccus sp.]|nr:hypothetical protein [Croceicoccus sp.]